MDTAAMWKRVIKIVKGLLATLGFLLVLMVLAPLLLSFNPFAKTDRAYCVEVADRSHFTGTYLKHHHAQSASVVKTSVCEELDRKMDAGDGMKAGRVRWVVCPRGPDCDEAGLF
ncbi:MAG: hypothetical protein FD135_1471 [Comamonadaceae bacterium]|nr:MAG: hypothetical protein FD135_1471 [Comamonadaceae bacterium]